MATSARWCHMTLLDHVTPTATSCHPLTKAEKFCRKFGNLFHHNLTLCAECFIRNYVSGVQKHSLSKLTANVHKCGSMMIGTRHWLGSDHNLCVKVNNELVSNMITWAWRTRTHYHGVNIYRKAMFKVGTKDCTCMWRRIKQKVPQGLLLSLIYQTTIQPHIDYCVIVWGYAPDISK